MTSALKQHRPKLATTSLVSHKHAGARWEQRGEWTDELGLHWQFHETTSVVLGSGHYRGNGKITSGGETALQNPGHKFYQYRTSAGVGVCLPTDPWEISVKIKNMHQLEGEGEENGRGKWLPLSQRCHGGGNQKNVSHKLGSECGHTLLLSKQPGWVKAPRRHTLSLEREQ